MRRLILGVLFSLLSFAAHAACPGSPSTCGDPLATGTSGSVLYAKAFGVKADGTTSDDVALKAATDACAAKSTRLILPPGQILLTGAATIAVHDCHIEGYGTTVLITNPDVSPFTIQNNWSIKGVTFYWPNQTTGTQAYQPLFSPTDTAASTYSWILENVTIVNAYDAIVAQGGPFRVVNSLIYAVHDAFRIQSIGDSFYVSGVHFTPGPWYALAPGAPALILTVTNTNTIFHFVGGGNNAINFGVTGSGGFAWRYAVKVGSGAVVGLSQLDLSIDGVGTYLDTASGGGIWAAANQPISGLVGCYRANQSGAEPGVTNPPCFNLGAQDDVMLDNFNASAYGTFVESAGSSVIINNSNVNVGLGKDGTDHYVVHLTGNSGGTTVNIRNSAFGGDSPATTKSHGFKSTVVVPRAVIQDSSFIYFNDMLDFQPGPTASVTGNWFDQTTSAQTIVPGSLNSSNTVLFHNNQLDKPPVITCTGCGTGYSINGTWRGAIQLGTGTINGFTLQFPWRPPGGDPSCQFNPEAQGVTIGGVASGIPPIVTVTASSNISGGRVAFDCTGTQ